MFTGEFAGREIGSPVHDGLSANQSSNIFGISQSECLFAPWHVLVTVSHGQRWQQGYEEIIYEERQHKTIS